MAIPNKIKREKYKLALVVVMFALVGSWLLLQSRAATVTGDLNNDGTVNLFDLSILLSNWNKTATTTPPPTTPPPTTPPPTTTPPSPTTATCGSSANTPTSPVTGYHVVKCEDFNSGMGAFKPYTSGGGDTVVGPGRTAYATQCKAEEGMLKQLQRSDGGTCGGNMSGWSQRYGYWEAKVRAYSTGSSSGSAPHPVLIIWPDTEWNDGELDYFETDIGDNGMEVFLHCVGNPSSNCVSKSYQMDITQWHVVGFEWTSTGFKGFVDGKEIYSVGSSGASMPVAGDQTIQLDNLSGDTPVKPGEFDIDWVHMYSK